MSNFPIDANVPVELKGAEVTKLKEYDVINIRFASTEDEDLSVRKAIFFPRPPKDKSEEEKKRHNGRVYHFTQECREVAEVLGADVSDIPETGNVKIYATYVAEALNAVRGTAAYIKTLPKGEYVNVSRVRPYISTEPNLEYGKDYKGNMEYTPPGEEEIPEDLLDEIEEIAESE